MVFIITKYSASLFKNNAWFSLKSHILAKKSWKKC